MRHAGLGFVSNEKGPGALPPGLASACEGCLKPRQQLFALGQTMGDKVRQLMFLSVTGPSLCAITQASTPDLGHNKASCDAWGRVIQTIQL